jgi:hypothetical protein
MVFASEFSQKHLKLSLAIYFASEIGIISLDINGVLIIAGILSVIDVALYFVGTATFQHGEILTKWK